MLLNAGFVWAGLAVRRGWILAAPPRGAPAGFVGLVCAPPGGSRLGVVAGDAAGAGGFVDPKTGLVDMSNTNIFGPVVNYFPAAGGGPVNLPGWAAQEGDTKTYGAVVKVLPWLNVHLHKSDSFAPQVVRQRIFTSFSPTSAMPHKPAKRRMPVR